jgi:hypothetical protein
VKSGAESRLSDRTAGAAEPRGPSTSYVEGPLPWPHIVADTPASIADDTPNAERSPGVFARCLTVRRRPLSNRYRPALAERRDRSFSRTGAVGSAGRRDRPRPGSRRAHRLPSSICSWRRTTPFSIGRPGGGVGLDRRSRTRTNFLGGRVLSRRWYRLDSPADRRADVGKRTLASGVALLGASTRVGGFMSLPAT